MQAGPAEAAGDPGMGEDWHQMWESEKRKTDGNAQNLSQCEILFFLIVIIISSTSSSSSSLPLTFGICWGIF